MSSYNLLANFGHLLLITNCILFFKNYRSYSTAIKIFSFYLATILIIQLTSKYLRSYKIPNLYLSHYYFIGQFLFLSFFFKQLLKHAFHKKIITFVLFTVLSMLAIYYSLYPSAYYSYSIFEIVITSVPLMFYSLLFFIQKIERENNKFNYIVAGFFLYILCSTLLFTAGNIKADIKRIVWYANVSLYIVYQFLILTEWYTHFRKNESPS